jgi:cytoskeletal protein CcmA (bactofilin family)
MKRRDILQRLEERLARGEISEKTYLDIKARYDAEPEEPAGASSPGPSLEDSIHETVSRATEEAFRLSQESMQAVNDSMRAMRGSMRETRDSLRALDFAGVGVKLSEEEIKIVGSGVVVGNPVKTIEFKAAGRARVRGPLECESVKISGSCDFDGDVLCAEFRSSGSSRVAGFLKAQDVDVSGSLEVAKDLDALDTSASGGLRVDGNVHGQDFRSTGAVRIQGELKAQDVDIELGGSSQIGKIEAQDISVRAAGGFVRSRGDLTADRIVGQDIDLVGTNAAYVEGHDVRLGPHCYIGVVVAQELVVHESSEVKERRVQNE